MSIVTPAFASRTEMLLKRGEGENVRSLYGIPTAIRTSFATPCPLSTMAAERKVVGWEGGAKVTTGFWAAAGLVEIFRASFDTTGTGALTSSGTVGMNFRAQAEPMKPTLPAGAPQSPM